MKLKVLLIFGALFAHAAVAESKDDKAVMLELADQSRCLTCHDVDEKIRGPAWRDVARRYRDKPEEEERLVQKVFNGGGGAWGDDTMSSNKRAGMENIRVLVHWILSLP